MAELEKSKYSNNKIENNVVSYESNNFDINKIKEDIKDLNKYVSALPKLETKEKNKLPSFPQESKKSESSDLEQNLFDYNPKKEIETEFYIYCSDCDSKEEIDNIYRKFKVCSYCGSEEIEKKENEKITSEWEIKYKHLENKIKTEGISDTTVVSEYKNQILKLSELRILNKLEDLIGQEFDFKSENGNITYVNLITSKNINKFSELKHLKRIDLKTESLNFLDNTEANFLQKIKNLELNYIKFKESPEEDFNYFNELINLKELNLNQIYISNTRFLKKLNKLEKFTFNGVILDKDEIIDLSNNDLTITPFRKKLKNVEAKVIFDIFNYDTSSNSYEGGYHDEYIKIYNNHIISFETDFYNCFFNENLSKLTKLESITLYKTHLESMEYKTRKFYQNNQIKDLKIMLSGRVDFFDFSFLSNFTSLESIEFRHTKFLNLNFIDNLSNLKRLTLSSCETKKKNMLKKYKHINIISKLNTDY